MPSLREVCAQAGQEYLLRFWDRLSPAKQQTLETQIRSLDLDSLGSLVHGNVEGENLEALAQRAEPPDAVALGHGYQGWTDADACRAGAEAIAAGKVGMILVAGGQGTRLGFDQPKGMFSIGPLSGRTLFEMHVDSLRGAMRRFGVSIPLWIMTSPATDAATRAYFDEHDRLGLTDDQLFLFQQGTMPALDAATGRVLMESPSGLALSPDGHGGIVAALSRCGALDWAHERGIEQFFYAQVDNPLVRACDPLLIGYHRLSGSQMTTQVVRKRFAKERVGNVVRVDGRTRIIEYSDLPDSVAEQVHPDGSLKLWAGNIAVHVFDREFLERAATHAEALPFHRASKVVPFLDDDGVLQTPTAPNAIKLERFVFDLLPWADRTLVVEGDAKEVFAPVKNAEGAATDTPSASRQAIAALHRSWLRGAGMEVDDSVVVEVHPLWAWDAEEVAQRLHAPSRLEADTYFA